MASAPARPRTAARLRAYPPRHAMRRAAALPLLLALLLPGAAAAADGPCGPRIELPFSMRTLANGLKVVVHEDHTTPSVAVDTWYHVGSARETPGRTGLAHLFEHIMFGGSRNVPEGAFDRWLEAVGGENNGGTDSDHTGYWENVPSNAVEMALFLESDRMATLASVLSPARVDQQRDVVKNERRQSYENAPYGMAPILIAEALYPQGHPYRWPTIGSMDDLTAASYEDVAGFFRRWYGPGNAAVVIAGDIDTKTAFALAEKWFGDVPASAPVPPPVAPPVVLRDERRLVHEDRVEVPRLYVSWPAPARFSPPSAALDVAARVLAQGKSSRLWRRLVYDLGAAQDVAATFDGGALAGSFDVVVTARPGHALGELYDAVLDEVARLSAAPPSAHELDRVRSQVEAELLSRLESSGGFGGKAELLDEYLFFTGNPGYAAQDAARYRALSPADVTTAAARYLGPGRVTLSVVPKGRRPLAVGEVSR